MIVLRDRRDRQPAMAAMELEMGGLEMTISTHEMAAQLVAFVRGLSARPLQREDKAASGDAAQGSASRGGHQAAWPQDTTAQGPGETPRANVTNENDRASRGVRITPGRTIY